MFVLWKWGLYFVAMFRSWGRCQASRRGTTPSAVMTMHRSFSTSSNRHLKTIYVAMSGGVDSSVAAELLIRSGHPASNIKPVFVRSWSNDDADKISHSSCQWKKDWNDLLLVCNQLHVGPPQLLDLSKEYWNRVWQPCLEVWESGGTPNTDVMCNRYIKFGILAERLLRNDCDSLLATGHYARLEYEPRLKLLQAVDKRKDQSYYLSTTSPEILRRTTFPLGNLTKTEVRKIAHDRGFINARKKESMGVCFVEPTIRKGHFHTILAEHLHQKPGHIVSRTGEILGTHQGLWDYTIGQRCRIPSQPTKMFVSAKDVKNNQITVVPSYNHVDLHSEIICCKDFRWIQADFKSQEGKRLGARLRTGNLDPIPCSIKFLNDDGSKLRVELDRPEHGVASGQTLVLQQGEEILGGGVIEAANRNSKYN